MLWWISFRDRHIRTPYNKIKGTRDVRETRVLHRLTDSVQHLFFFFFNRKDVCSHPNCCVAMYGAVFSRCVVAFSVYFVFWLFHRWKSIKNFCSLVDCERFFYIIGPRDAWKYVCAHIKGQLFLDVNILFFPFSQINRIFGQYINPWKHQTQTFLSKSPFSLIEGKTLQTNK
jgi:hypothetical protein